jgi:hypothetical protein
VCEEPGEEESVVIDSETAGGLVGLAVGVLNILSIIRCPIADPAPNAMPSPSVFTTPPPPSWFLVLTLKSFDGGGGTFSATAGPGGRGGREDEEALVLDRRDFRGDDERDMILYCIV